MEFAKIIRFLVGSMGVLMIGYLLYQLWRLYAYFYLEVKEKAPPAKVAPMVSKDTYKAPRFVYDAGKHEFFVRND